MSFITLANTNKIIFNSDIQSLDLTGDIYKIPIYFFSKYEENALLAIQELLKDPDKYFTEIYKPYKPVDTYSYVYEGQKPGYHKFSCCPRLQSDYQNFEVPQEIKDKGPDAVQEFRQWFETVKHLLDKPDIFVERLRIKYGIVTNPKAINRDNSGSTEMENLTIEELEKRIDSLIKEAGRFFYKSEKNTTILKRFSKFTHIAYKSDDIYNNDTGYSDEEVKELLKGYDAEFKRPLKRYLIEYYRMKLNPEIKMEGHFLEQLGFKPCGHCHSQEYEPNTNDEYLNEAFIVENWSFFNSVFATHYPFTIEQLINLKDEICWGGCVYSFYDNDYMHFYQPPPGAIFNSSISWTKTLIDIADFECNHLAGTWYDEDAIPLDKRTELERNDSELLNGIISGCSTGEEAAEATEGYETSVEFFDRKYESINPDELSQIILDFEDKKRVTKAIIFNPTFYNVLIKCIKQTVQDFDILDFYEKIKNTAPNKG